MQADRRRASRERRLLIWGPNARGGGGRTSLHEIVSAFAKQPEIDECLVFAPLGVIGAVKANVRTVELNGFPSRLSAEIRLFFFRRTHTVVAPLNFSPIAGGDVLYQRNALYFDLRSRDSFMERAGLRLRKVIAVAQSNRATIVVVPSEAMKAALVHARVRRPVRVIPHGVPQRLSSVNPAGAETWDGADIKLAWIGVPTPQKNLVVLADMLAALRNNTSGSCVLVMTAAADGSRQAGRLLQRATELEVSGGIRLLGAMAHDQALAVAAGADCVVIPSTVESFGLPVVEALAAGTRAVVSPAAALREFAKYGATVAAGWDGASFAEAVLEALARDAPSPGIERHFDWSVHASNVLAQLARAGGDHSGG